MIREKHTTDRRFQIIIGSLRDLKKDKEDKSEIEGYFGRFDTSKFNQDVLGIIAILKREGYDVKALCKGEFCDLRNLWIPWSPAFSKKAESLGAIIEYVSVPGGISLMLGRGGQNPVFNFLHNASERPRDAFVQIDNKIYLNKDYYPKKIVSERDHRGYISRMRWLVPGELEKVAEVEKEQREYTNININIEDKEKWKQYYDGQKKLHRKVTRIEQEADNYLTLLLQPSPFGEGGRVIVFSDFIIASDEIQRKTHAKKDYRVQDKPVYFVSPTNARIGKFTKKSEEVRFHIDYFVNGIDLSSHSFVYIDPDFYKKNNFVFKRIEKNHNVDICLVPKNEQKFIPSNFLVIPNGKILIPNGTPQTYRCLEQRLGSENVLVTENPLPNLLNEGYGPRCITNIICY